MRVLSAAGAGFLLAVLWFDLMFDVQVLRQHDREVPEPVLASISAYYRRVTTDSRPMNRLVAVVMAATAGSVVAEVVVDRGPRWTGWASLALVVGAVVLAGSRTVPRAVRLGARRDPLSAQSDLARSILRDHLTCLAAITALLVLQLTWAR
jgi:hypothetical protein